MKSILRLKFIALYLIFAFLCIFTTATLTTQLVMDRLEEDTSRTLYRGATLVASDYLPSYFTDDSSVQAVQSQLAAMRLYLESSLWFVQRDGVMITASNLENTSSPEAIENFDPAEIGGNQYIVGTYHGYFDEDVITVMAPVTEGFSTKGYLLLHSPVSFIEEKCRALMFPIYVSLGVIYLISFIFLLGFHFFVYRPLRQITEAAKQYASGNLDYEIPVSTHDEMGYLSASLNYMAVQLKDMDDYQKKIVANVSHDFRSPLTSIKGFAELLASGALSGETAQRAAQTILTQSERLTNLVASIINYNEIDSDDLPTYEVNASKVAHELLETLSPAIAERHITLETRIEPDVLLESRQERVTEIFGNLIRNAIRYNRDGGSITVVLTKTEFSVADTGIGIAKENLERIFDRFFTVDKSHSGKNGGFGLGLSVVKKLCRKAGWWISVESEEGKGSVFTVRFSR